MATKERSLRLLGILQVAASEYDTFVVQLRIKDPSL